MDRSKKPRSGSIIDPSRSRRACIFPLLITCPNWSITLITVSYGGEASRNDKNLSSLSLQASFHPRVIPASPETGGGRAHLQRRNLSPAGKNQPRLRFREEERGAGPPKPRPFCRLEASPTFGFPLSRALTPSTGSVAVSFQATKRAPSPFPPPLLTEAPPPAKRKSPSAAVRRWSKSVHTESSSRVEASSGQLAGDPSIRRSTAHLSNVSRTHHSFLEGYDP